MLPWRFASTNLERMKRFLISDSRLLSIAEKVDAGGRLSREDGLLHYARSDLIGIGAMANAANCASVVRLAPAPT